MYVCMYVCIRMYVEFGRPTIGFKKGLFFNAR